MVRERDIYIYICVCVCGIQEKMELRGGDVEEGKKEEGGGEKDVRDR